MHNGDEIFCDGVHLAALPPMAAQGGVERDMRRLLLWGVRSMRLLHFAILLSVAAGCDFALSACSGARTIPGAGVPAENGRAFAGTRAGSGKVITLFTFTGTATGEIPNAPLVRDAQGNLYGTAMMAVRPAAASCLN